MISICEKATCEDGYQITIKGNYRKICPPKFINQRKINTERKKGITLHFEEAFKKRSLIQPISSKVSKAKESPINLSPRKRHIKQNININKQFRSIPVSYSQSYQASMLSSPTNQKRVSLKANFQQQIYSLSNRLKMPTHDIISENHIVLFQESRQIQNIKETKTTMNYLDKSEGKIIQNMSNLQKVDSIKQMKRTVLINLNQQKLFEEQIINNSLKYNIKLYEDNHQEKVKHLSYQKNIVQSRECFEPVFSEAKLKIEQSAIFNLQTISLFFQIGPSFQDEKGSLIYLAVEKYSNLLVTIKKIPLFLIDSISQEVLLHRQVQLSGLSVPLIQLYQTQIESKYYIFINQACTSIQLIKSNVKDIMFQIINLIQTMKKCGLYLRKDPEINDFVVCYQEIKLVNIILFKLGFDHFKPLTEILEKFEFKLKQKGII